MNPTKYISEAMVSLCLSCINMQLGLRQGVYSISWGSTNMIKKNVYDWSITSAMAGRKQSICKCLPRGPLGGHRASISIINLRRLKDPGGRLKTQSTLITAFIASSGCPDDLCGYERHKLGPGHSKLNSSLYQSYRKKWVFMVTQPGKTTSDAFHSHKLR